MRSLLVPVAALAMLSACGDGTSGATGAGNDGVPSNNEPLAQALDCWALTNRATMTHQALGTGTGNLPNPNMEIYLGWHQRAAIIGNERGLSLPELEELQRAAQKAHTIYSLDVEPAYAEAVQKCIDTAPAFGPDPDLKWKQS